MLDRRNFLKVALAAQAFAAIPANARMPVSASGSPTFFLRLAEGACAGSCSGAIQPPAPPRSGHRCIDRLRRHGKLKYKNDFALYGDGHPSAFPITFMHVGQYFPKTVRMYALEPSGDGGSSAREILYDPDYFQFLRIASPQSLPAKSLALRRLLATRAESRRRGLAHRRALGGLPRRLLFPRDRRARPGRPVRARHRHRRRAGNATRSSPTSSPSGFTPRPRLRDTVTVLRPARRAQRHRRLPLRHGRGRRAWSWTSRRRCSCARPIERLGLAPLTSMYWYSETVKQAAIDWRPEVHDSDGLAMWTGAGERIWRPLNNPPRTSPSRASSTSNPRGFGLLQRDREFDHYLDGVGYERRPSAWVEPLGDWGKGVVQLVEIPTDDEIHDNVVAYWVPAEPTQAGDRHRAAATGCTGSPTSPSRPPLGRCVATRLGRGGQPGQPRPDGVRKFMVEFLGGPLGETAVRRQAGARALGLARQVLLHLHRGRARRRAGPLARPVRSHRRGPRAGRDAPLPASGRPGPDRDLALPVPPLRDGRAPRRILSLARPVLCCPLSRLRERVRVRHRNSVPPANVHTGMPAFIQGIAILSAASPALESACPPLPRAASLETPGPAAVRPCAAASRSSRRTAAASSR